MKIEVKMKPDQIRLTSKSSKAAASSPGPSKRGLFC